MKKKLLFLLVLLLTAGTGNLVWAETATQDKFWRFNAADDYGEDQKDDNAKTLVIKTAGELAKFAQETIYNNFEGWTITLDADIDLSDKNWHPISPSNAFKGTFNGNEHTITGVTMNTGLITTDSKTDPATLRCNAFGLFGVVEGTVENVKLEETSIYVLATPISSSGMRVAALVGQLKAGGTIRNCVVNGGTVHGKQYVGALVGQVESNGTNSDLATIVGCESSAAVIGVSFVGGLVGQLTGNASLRYCLYTGTTDVTLTSSNGYIGQVVGDMSGATASGESETETTYFTGSELTPKNSRDRKAYTVSLTNPTTGLELDFGPSITYSLSGITAYEHILYYDSDGTGTEDPGHYYAGADDKVVFGFNITDNTKTFITNVLVNNLRPYKETSTTYSFTMGNEKADVTADLLTDNSWDQHHSNEFSVIHEGEKEIIIETAYELGLLAYNVNEGINDYQGWTIELGDNISLSEYTWVPIGTADRPFRGTFDGKGKTIRSLLIADTRWATDYTGLFGYGYNCTIKGVRLERCMIGGNNYVGGVIGLMYGSQSKVKDCNVDVSCVISGSGEYVGGIVGYAKSNTYVEGCVNAAPVQGVARVGGIVGQIDAYAHVNNNIFNGLDGDVTATSGNRRAYIIGNINSNTYYTQNNYTLTSTQINDFDTHGYSVTSGNSNITLTFNGENNATYTTYSTSGITAYYEHLRINGVYYAKKSAEQIQLTLNHTNTNATFKNVAASSGTLTAVTTGNANNSRHTLILNDDNQTNCVITANIDGYYWTDEGIRATSLPAPVNNIITISTAAELGLLAYNVNNGTSYEGLTIKLSDDISLAYAAENIQPHWVPIGTNQKPFKGTFDGNGKTISGMNIQDGDVEYYAGLFGYVTGNAVVKHVKLANSNIRGTNYVGGIAGITGSSVTIEDCLVGTDVTVTGGTYVGGIVGRLYGTLRGCVSGATLAGKEETSQNNIGGIIGENASGSHLLRNVYNGTSVTGKSCVAAVIGRIMAGERSKNYFVTPALKGLNDFDHFAYTITSGTTGESINMTVGLYGTPTEFSTSGLTFYENGGFKFGETIYGGNNEQVGVNTTVTPHNHVYAIKANDDGTLLSYHGTGFNMTDADGTGWFTLTVNDTNYELTAVNASTNFEGKGEDFAPYLIRTKEEMKQLSLVVNNGDENYKDKFFRLENDLTYTNEESENSKFTPVGNGDHPFMGYFDGNGKTISGITYVKTDESGPQYLGVFGFIQYGEVSHLKLSNSTFTGNSESYVGGIVGFCQGTLTSNSETTTILDCIVDNNVCVTGKYVGGIAGWVGSGTEDVTAKCNVEGCVSAAIVTATSTNSSAGGVIGWIRANQIQIKNCLYTGNSVTRSNDSSGSLAYCVGNYNTTGASPLDIYYTNLTLEDINTYDRKGYTVAPVTPVNVYKNDQIIRTTELTLEFTEPTFHYDLTGIQGYKVGLSYDGHFYATEGQPAKFTLESGEGTISTVTATDANSNVTNLTPTDAVYSLTLGASSYTISANVAIEWAGAGTEGDPYIIDDIEKMNLLSERSQSNSFEGKHFRLTADLDYSKETETDGSNFTPVRMFRGTFDGNGHTISGVKVNETRRYYDAGLFNKLNLKSKVMNLTIANSTFISTEGQAGVIAGNVAYSNTGGTEPSITNCHVGNDVTVTSSASGYSAGGIAGNMEVGRIEGCTSAAKVSQTGGGYAGGLVGSTTFTYVKIHDNIFTGTVTAINGVVDAIDANPKKVEQMYANFYTEDLTSLIGSKAYECTGIYNADAAYTYSVAQKDANGTATDAGTITGIIRYDNDLLKYDGKFYSKFQKGDCNADGVVNVTDYVGVIDYIHGRTTGLNAFTTDANGDGVVNVTDAVRVIDIIHGK